MTTIKNMADLKAWLEGAPGHWPITLAARAALRALPVLYSEIEDIETINNWRNFLILPTFRANFISVFVSRYPNVKIKVEVFDNATDKLIDINDVEAIDAAFHTVLFAETNEYVSFESAIACASKAVMNDFLFWKTLEFDAQFLQSGGDVWSLPLWPVDFPVDFDALWDTLKQKLIYRAPYWIILTQWYEARLSGDSEPNVSARNSDRETDLEIIALENEIWLSGKQVNNAIAAIWRNEWSGDEEGVPIERPQIPEQKPAALEPVWVDNRLRLPGGASKADLPSDPLGAALAALKLDLEALVSDAQTVSNIDQRLVGYLDHIAGIVPSSAPDQASLFRLGHAFEPIKLSQKTVQAEWPDVLGFRFAGLLLAFERTLKQFPEWRQFTKIADDIHLTQAEIAAAPKLAEQLVETLREPEIADVVAPEIPNELEALVSGEIDPSWNGEFSAMSEQRAIDAIESSSNIMKRFLEPVFDGFKTRDEAAKGVRYTVGKSVYTALQKEAENSGPAMVKLAKRLLKYGTPGAVSYTLFSQLDWLRPIVEFLKAHSGL